MKQHPIIEIVLNQKKNHKKTTAYELENILTQYYYVENLTIGYRNPIILSEDWEELIDTSIRFKDRSKTLKKIYIFLFSSKNPIKDIDLFFKKYEKYNEHLHLIVDISEDLSENVIKFLIKNNELESPFPVCLRISIKRPDKKKIQQLLKTVSDKTENFTDIYFDHIAETKQSINITRPFDIDSKIAYEKAFDNMFKELKNDFKIVEIENNIEDCSDFFKRRPCRELFSNPYLFKDKATICTRDKELKHAYNISEKNKNEKKNRYLHITGFFDRIEKCSICPYYEPLSEKEILAFLEKENKASLISYYRNRMNSGFFFNIYKLENIEGLLALTEDLFPEKLEKTKEDDFCCAWTRILKKEDGRLYSGCKKAKIPIDDYESFCKALSNLDYSSIPDSCFYCQDKFSLNPVNDRQYHYRFSDNEFHKASVKTKHNLIHHIALNKLLELNKDSDITKLLKKINRYTIWRYFLVSNPTKTLKDEAIVQQSPMLITNTAVNDPDYIKYIPLIHKRYSWKRIPVLKIAFDILLQNPLNKEYLPFKSTFDYILDSKEIRKPFIFILEKTHNLKKILTDIKDSPLISKTRKKLLFSDELIFMILTRLLIKDQDNTIYDLFLTEDLIIENKELFLSLIMEDIKKDIFRLQNHINNIPKSILEEIVKNELYKNKIGDDSLKVYRFLLEKIPSDNINLRKFVLNDINHQIVENLENRNYFKALKKLLLIKDNISEYTKEMILNHEQAKNDSKYSRFIKLLDKKYKIFFLAYTIFILNGSLFLSL